ncbi:MAG TPA: pilus assembly protein TadG-related protein [Gemmatimonadales bacterium]|nr:pilus assembly protein TadG-related protein [Gemmatimonadales bacterium]
MRVFGGTTTARRGATLPLFAVALFMMLALAAIAIDLGRLYVAQTEAQRAADSAALAGAEKFKEQFDADAAAPLADSVARDYAKRNAIQHVSITDADIVSVNADPATLQVRVVLQRTGIQNWFASTLGFATSTVAAAATAEAAPAGEVQCIKPIAAQDLWNEPGTPTGLDTLTSTRDLPLINPSANKVWDLPPPPSSGGAGNSVPVDNPPHPREEWRWDATGSIDPGQVYVPQTQQGATGWGSTYRDGLAGAYLAATNHDVGRRLVLMIMDGNGNDVDITPHSFFQAWLPQGQAGKMDLANDIRNGCDIASAVVGDVEGEYTVEQNGLGTGQVGKAWDDLYQLDPNATWNENVTSGGADQITGSNKCPASGACEFSDWKNSPRVITIGIYNPTLYGTSPSNNDLAFLNFARVFMERPYKVGNGQNAKRWVMGRFIGYADGVGAGAGGATGSLIKILRLVK